MNVVSECVRGVCVCVLPREDNDHRPYALRHGTLSAVSAFLVLLKLLTIVVIGLTPAQAELSTITVNRIVQLTNGERKKAGLEELSINSKLSHAAQLKGEDMLAHQYFAHISPTGVTPWFWMAKTGYSYQVAGENLAIDFIEAEDVVSAWIASPSHKENMLRSDYLETGVAVVSGEFEGGTSTIVVHMFGKPTASTPQVASQVSAPSSSPSPAPSPSSSPSPSASPTPAPSVSATPAPPSAPRAPRIDTSDGNTTVESSVPLTISGQAGTTAHVLVNNQVHGEVVIPSSGVADYTLNIETLADGDITIRAYITSNAGLESSLSPAVVVTKDTQALADISPIFLLSPITDNATLAVHVPTDIASRLTIQDGTAPIRFNPDTGWAVASVIDEPISLARSVGKTTKTVASVSIQPEFTTPAGETVSEAPAVLSLISHRLTISIFVALLILLFLTVVIRIRIQHPALITHASLVLVLAFALIML